MFKDIQENGEICVGTPTLSNKRPKKREVKANEKETES